jgi:hypothetical protein
MSSFYKFHKINLSQYEGISVLLCYVRKYYTNEDICYEIWSFYTDEVLNFGLTGYVTV